MNCPSNLLSLLLAVLAACVSPAVVMGADDPQATKAAGRGNTISTEKPPMIIPNQDGTFIAVRTGLNNSDEIGLLRSRQRFAGCRLP